MTYPMKAFHNFKNTVNSASDLHNILSFSVAHCSSNSLLTARTQLCSHCYNALSLSLYICIYIYIHRVIQNDCRVLTTCHTQYTWDRSIQLHWWIKKFSKFSFMFPLFPKVSRNGRHKSEAPLKPSPLTCYKQFGTNSIFVLMFVESQRVHI